MYHFVNGNASIWAMRSWLVETWAGFRALGWFWRLGSQAFPPFFNSRPGRGVLDHRHNLPLPSWPQCAFKAACLQRCVFTKIARPRSAEMKKPKWHGFSGWNSLHILSCFISPNQCKDRMEAPTVSKDLSQVQLCLDFDVCAGSFLNQVEGESHWIALHWQEIRGWCSLAFNLGGLMIYYAWWTNFYLNK